MLSAESGGLKKEVPPRPLTTLPASMIGPLNCDQAVSLARKSGPDARKRWTLSLISPRSGAMSNEDLFTPADRSQSFTSWDCMARPNWAHHWPNVEWGGMLSTMISRSRWGTPVVRRRALAYSDANSRSPAARLVSAATAGRSALRGWRVSEGCRAAIEVGGAGRGTFETVAELIILRLVRSFKESLGINVASRCITLMSEKHSVIPFRPVSNRVWISPGGSGHA